jgi:hypothetical protein
MLSIQDYSICWCSPGVFPPFRGSLYSYLEQLGPRALYADTDSGEWKPELGDYLVDLPNEVPDNRII